MRATPGPVGEFGQGVGNTARADIMHRKDRIAVTGHVNVFFRGAHLPAAIKHFLRPPLHLRVPALHRGEIEVFAVAAGTHRACCTAAQTDQHARPTQLNKQRSGGESRRLVRLRRRNVADPAGNHDWLVVAAHHLTDRLFIGAEITGEIRATEFIVERRRANRPFKHDLQRRSNARRAAIVGHRGFPRLLSPRQIEVGNGKTTQAGLGPRATAGRAFVADLAAGAGCRAGKGRNRCRVIVRFDLGQDVRQFLRPAISTARAGIQTFDFSPLENRGVIRINHHVPRRMCRMGFADHAEQGFLARFAIQHPRRIENLVAAMLGIGLREHHELNVSRIAPGFDHEEFDEVVNFIFGEREAQASVGLDQRLSSTGEQIDRRHRLGWEMAEEFGGPGKIGKDILGHPVMQQRRHGKA